MHLNFGAGVLAFEIGWQCRDSLHFLERGLRPVVLEDGKRAGHFVYQICEPAGRVESQVPWTGTGLYRNERRLAGREICELWFKPVEQNFVEAKVTGHHQ